MDRWTQLVHYSPCPNDPYHANNTPIYQTATFAQEGTEGGPYDYTRSGNPTRTVLEKQLAQLEQGQFGFAFSSGMAAINVVTGLLQQGDHIVAGDDLYGGTQRLLAKRLIKRGIEFTLVDPTDIKAVASACRPNTRLILVETPSNPLQKIADIAKLSMVAKLNKALLAIDNTFLSPWLQQPLSLGADIVIHSATKHLSGHSDIIAGALIVNDKAWAQEIAFIQNAEGACLPPFDCSVLLRGLKTLGLRIERQQQTACRIAHFLKNCPAVKKVYYPGLDGHPGKKIHDQQAKGPGTLVSFELSPGVAPEQWIKYLKLFTISVSFGSLNSLVNLPINMSHASVPENERHRLSAGLIRLSIGIEDKDDLIEDLAHAFKKTTQLVCAVGQ